MPVEKPCLLMMLLISMPQRGIHNLRHKSVHDLTETLLSEVCHNTSTEPALQSLTGESLRLRTAKRMMMPDSTSRPAGFGGQDKRHF